MSSKKIYEKIYPLEPDPQDNLIFRKCVLLSFVEPKNFLILICFGKSRCKYFYYFSPKYFFIYSLI